MILKNINDREMSIEFRATGIHEDYLEEFRDTVRDYIYDYADTDAFCASFAMGEKDSPITPVYSEYVSVRDHERAIDVSGKRLLSAYDNPNSQRDLWEDYRDDIVSIWDMFENGGKPNKGVLNPNGKQELGEIAGVVLAVIRGCRKFPGPDRFPTSDSQNDSFDDSPNLFKLRG